MTVLLGITGIHLGVTGTTNPCSTTAMAVDVAEVFSQPRATEAAVKHKLRQAALSI